MKREEFEGLIQRLEELATARPATYRLRVGLLAVLGYAYLFAVLGLLLAVTLGIVALVIAAPNALTIKLGIGFGAVTVGLTVVIVRALWVRMKEPEGLLLTAAEVPTLFATIEEVRCRINAPRFHRVLLTDDFNAAVLQVPRLGVLGWQKNFLILGLPLMEALSPEEFRSVIAHEFAHLSRSHSRFSGWIYRVRRTWDNVFAQMAQQRQSGWALFLKFFRWYAPFFDAYSFVLARQNEYEADRCAVQVAGLPVAAQALVRVQLQGRLLSEHFWPGMFRRATREAAPPAAAFVGLGEHLRKGAAPNEAARWLDQAMAVRTSLQDTHPCLKERLKGMHGGESVSLSTPPALPGPVVQTAGDVFIGAALPRLRSTLEEQWRKGVEPEWKSRFEQAQALRERLEKIQGEIQNTPPTLQQQWEQVSIRISLEGDEAAEPLLRAFLEMVPDHAPANFTLGRILLDRDDDAGVQFIEKAMQADPEAVHPGCNLLYGLYERTGRHELTRALTRRYDEHSDQLALAQQERERITNDDAVLPHELSAEQIEAIRKQLLGKKGLGGVWIARKAVRYFPEKPCYLVAIQPDYKWWHVRSSDADSKLVVELANHTTWPGETYVFARTGSLKKLAARIVALPGAQIV